MNFTTLALGGEIGVPSVSGEPQTLKIPDGTATGSIFRLRGKGMPDVSGRPRRSPRDGAGDHARKLTKEQRRLLEQLAAALPSQEFEPTPRETTIATSSRKSKTSGERSSGRAAVRHAHRASPDADLRIGGDRHHSPTAIQDLLTRRCRRRPVDPTSVPTIEARIPRLTGASSFPLPLIAIGRGRAQPRTDRNNLRRSHGR